MCIYNTYLAHSEYMKKKKKHELPVNWMRLRLHIKSERQIFRLLCVWHFVFFVPRLFGIIGRYIFCIAMGNGSNGSKYGLVSHLSISSRLQHCVSWDEWSLFIMFVCALSFFFIHCVVTVTVDVNVALLVLLLLLWCVCVCERWECFVLDGTSCM